MTRRETVFKSYNEQRETFEQKTKSGIELNRKTYARLSFVDKEKKPLKNVKFSASLADHEYKFGCNLFMLDEFETQEKNEKYRKIFADTFNYAVVPFYWNTLEPEKGKPRYEKSSPRVYRRPSPDLCVEYCKQKGIRMKGHCLVYDAFSPDWLPCDPALVWQEYEKHFCEIAQRYRDDIYDWDIVNEAISWPAYKDSNPGMTAIFRDRRFVEKCFEMGRRHFPTNNLFINEAAGIWERFRFDRSYLYLLLERYVREQVPFDSIGMQMHMFRKREDEMEWGALRYDPEKVYDVLDTFGEFNRPLHISEVTLPTYNGGDEDEEIQAQLLSMLYKLWFSHKATDGIAYWNLVDGYAHGAPIGALNVGENVYGGGLLNFDLSEKPAFKELKRLIKEEWTTKVSDISDEGGRATFRGFKGKYKLTYFVDGKQYDTEFSVTDNAAQTQIVAE